MYTCIALSVRVSVYVLFTFTLHLGYCWNEHCTNNQFKRMNNVSPMYCVCASHHILWQYTHVHACIRHAYTCMQTALVQIKVLLSLSKWACAVVVVLVLLYSIQLLTIEIYLVVACVCVCLCVDVHEWSA